MPDVRISKEVFDAFTELLPKGTKITDTQKAHLGLVSFAEANLNECKILELIGRIESIPLVIEFLKENKK